MAQELGQGLGLDGFIKSDYLEESRNEARALGVAEEDVDTSIEKAIYDAPGPERVPVLQEGMDQPELAEPLSAEIDNSKGAGVQEGPGIVAGIFAGLAGMFSEPGQGVKVATGLLDKWDPRKQEATRVAREGKAAESRTKVRADKQQSDMNDPESAISQSARAMYKSIMPSANLDGRSAFEIKSFAPDLWKATGLDQQSDATAARREDTEAQRGATAQRHDETMKQGERRQKFAEDKEATRTSERTAKVEEDARKQQVKEQSEFDERDQMRQQELASADATIKMFENVIGELEGGNVQTGPIIEMLAPVGAEEKEEAGFIRRAAGSIRQAMDPQVELINQVSARLNAEAKKLYDLGVMSKDDWNQMGKMSVSTGFDEAQNLSILKEQLAIIKNSKSGTVARGARDINPRGTSTTAPEITKKIGDKTYVKRNGKWYTE